ncbi:MAG: SIS domain-containing protein [Patescibacteria group bacterium]|jgi:glucose/mannose-6-phosphate isomerase
MMDKAIREFPKQFAYEPVIENAGALQRRDAFVVGGMGGSAHSSALMKLNDPYLDIVVHRGYGLPKLQDADLERRLVIAISYSGGTEEPLDMYRAAQKKGLPLAAVATGGKLIDMARADGVPYVLMPGAELQPRSGLAYTLRAQMKLMGDTAGLEETAALAKTLNPGESEGRGKELAARLKGKLPIVYSSFDFDYLGYVWKIKLNETGKIPAYRDVFPELNHNEMSAYDVIPATKHLSQNNYFIFLRDKNDHPRIQKRMEVTKKLYEERGLTVEEIFLEGRTTWEKIFSSLFIADWASYYTALANGADPENVTLQVQFKKLIV